MVGMRDVAKQAGVSVSTVSLVVNNAGYVSDDMRAKVEAAMHQLNYIPNELARNLYRNRTNTIGIIVPTILHPFFATLTAHMQRELAKRGLKTMLCSTADVATGESEYVNMLQRHMMDGIIMAAHTEHQPDYWTSIRRPIVAFDRILGAGIPAVHSDHEAGGRMIARQLIDSGVRHAVLVGGPRSQFTQSMTFPTVRYHLTVEHMLAETGIACDYVEAGSVTDVVAHEATATAIFERYPDVDAIIGSDVVAAVALQEAGRRGIAVPGDLQIIAYDGTLAADLAGKKLTVVRQDFPAIAAALAEQMDQQIEAFDTSKRERRGESADSSADSPVVADAATSVDAANVTGAAGVEQDDAAEPANRSAEAGIVIPVTFIPGETTR